jgi:L-threonylcarbamoyladenylate synthase
MDLDKIDQAVKILREGGLVAFPTETVYGLGADARSSSAIARIYHAKGRPSTNPLIVHVADAQIAKRYAADWPEDAERLAKAFWPGPITLVVPKSPQIVSEATAGRNTVGLRAPNHPLALQLLRVFDGPLAGPSANRSNRISPTTAEHVRQSLAGRVDLILDGGPCGVGIESTVIDLTSTKPAILRPGGISREAIEAVIGPVELQAMVTDISQSAASPGQQPVHYAPRTPAYRFESSEAEQVDAFLRRAIISTAVFITLRVWPDWLNFAGENLESFLMPGDPVVYARRLYSTLHDADKIGPAAIFIEMPPDTSAWNAVRDRIRRATQAVFNAG